MKRVHLASAFIFALLLVPATALGGDGETLGSDWESHFGTSGSLLAYGDVALSTVSQENVDSTSFGLDPTVQYFVIDGLAVGGSLPIDLDWNEGNASSEIGIRGRVSYHYPIITHGTVFGDAGLGFASRNSEGADATTGPAFDIGAGFNYVFGAERGGFAGLKLGYEYASFDGSARAGLLVQTTIGLYF